MARKKYSITIKRSDAPREEFKSQVAVYRRVAELGKAWREDDPRDLMVWVDEGRGWERFEDIDLSDPFWRWNHGSSDAVV